jgi:phage terminase large subunit
MKQLNVNSAYVDLYRQKKRYKHLFGGRGAGRSFEVAQYAITKLYSPEYFRGILARQHFADIRGSSFQQIIDIIEEKELQSDFHILENTMQITHLKTGNRIFAKGFRAASGNSTAKMKSITEATFVWIEEADEVSKDDFDKLDKSLRSMKGAELEIIFTYNTDNEDCFLKSEFHDKVRPEDTLLIHATYKDNYKNLHPDYIRVLERMIKDDPEAARSDVFGFWGGGKRGKVFENWQSVDVMPENFKMECYGLDFGFTNDPSALVHIRLSEGAIYIQELIYDYGLTNPEICKRMSEAGIKRNDTIFADSAEPKSIREILTSGFNIQSTIKGPDSIIQGIQKIKQYPVFLVRSPNIQKEIKNYIWQTDKQGKTINKPVDRFNHALDAIRYGVVGLVGRKTKESIITTPGKR